MTIAEVAATISQFGVAGLALVMWYLERDERRDAQKQNLAMSERMLTALIEAKAAIAQQNRVLGKSE